MIRRILLPLSGSALTTVAVRTAVDLARAHDAHLTGISFRQAPGRAWLHPLGGVGGVGRIQAQEEEAVWRRIAAAAGEFTAACREAKVAYDLQVPDADPFSALLAYGGAFDLVVFALRGLFDHPLVGDPARLVARLVAGGLGPTYAVAEHPRDAPGAILVALSGSPASLRALRDLLQLGLHPQAELHLLHVGEDRPMLERAAALATAHGRRVASVEIRQGSVVPAIRAAATQHGCGLVVMGDSGRSLFARDVLGDVALAMLREGELPLLLSH